MTVIFIFIGFLLAYMIGSIPTAVWYGKSKFGMDVRNHGSGNAGATNTFRVFGKKAGSIVMAIDIIKGVIATSIPILFSFLYFNVNADQYVQIQLLYGMGAVLGHIFPLYANFKGGKGVATVLGMVFAINLWAALACVAVFLIVFLISKYVSLGSMTAGLAFPLLLFIPEIYQHSPSQTLVGFGFFLFIMLVFTHRKNIRRLIDGVENKSKISFKKK